MRVIWSPLALERLNEIADYIAENNLDAAKLFVLDVFGVVDRLKPFPNSGRVVPEVKRQNIREIIFKNYRVVYRVERKRVSILTVGHGRQLLPLDEIK
jgi:plasmid stabilization system protein ParE